MKTKNLSTETKVHLCLFWVNIFLVCLLISFGAFGRKIELIGIGILITLYAALQYKFFLEGKL